MDKTERALCKIIEKCEICIGKDVISKERLMKELVQFFDKTISEQQHNVGFVLHTGSECFDVIALIYAALSNLLCTHYQPEEMASALIPGMMVLYYSGLQPERFRYIGTADTSDPILGGEGIILEADKGGRMFVPKSQLAHIVPYNGTSEKLGKVGLRKESGKRESFCAEVLGLPTNEIPRIVEHSTVVVISKERADELIRKIQIGFNKQKMELTELVPVSYYTEGEMVHQYGANASQAEPVLKLTGKMSVARNLMNSESHNKTQGLIVLGEKTLCRSELEIPEMIEKRSLPYVYICTQIDSEMAPSLIQKYPQAKIFACTKDFLARNEISVTVENSMTLELKHQIEAIVDKKVTISELDGLVLPQTYRDFKNCLYRIKLEDIDTDPINEFIVQAYSLMNLYLTAPFSTHALDSAISRGEINNIVSVDQRIQYLHETSEGFPGNLQSDSQKVVSILEECGRKLLDKSPKEQELRKILRGHKSGEKIAIITPKTYYTPLIRGSLSRFPMAKIMTANQFDNSVVYDLIIALGNINGKRFNVFRCKSASNIHVLLYKNETYRFKKLEKYMENEERIYSGGYMPAEVREKSNDLEADNMAEELLGIDEEIERFIDTVVIKRAKSLSNCGDSRSVQAEVTAVATLDSGEFAFFSKNYKAYVLDPITKVATETKCSELSEGDTIIFTRGNTKTRDIVESMLVQLIHDNKLPKDICEDYARSRRWKDVLRDYMYKTGQSAQKVAETMVLNGAVVQEMTVRGWLDEDSHTVGPRKIDSIQQIAQLAGDVELLNQAEMCFESCASIRRLRRKILDAIAKAILGSLAGKEDNTVIAQAVKEHVDDLAKVLKIEELTFVNEQMAVNMINRPITVKGKLEEKYGDI